VEEESGTQLVLKTGGLDLEPAEDTPKYINQYAGAMRTARIPHEELPAREVMERYPQFRLDDGVQAVYQTDAGLVDAGRANATHIALARARGATILDNTPVRSVRVVDDGVEVETDKGTFGGRRLIVAAGAWTNEVLRHVGVELPITCTQEQVTYFRAPNLDKFSPEWFPVWIWHGGPESTFYGVPVYGAPATKAGQDVGGDVVTVDTRTFEPSKRVLESVRTFLERYIPDSLGPELYTKTCLYDMPPDREFVLGALPNAPQISVFVGAGHGFKFASLAGKILSELGIYGKTQYQIEAFREDRPALTDPAYEPVFAM
jgi:sarcosine oxidase